MASRPITQFDFAAIDRLKLSQPTKKDANNTQFLTNPIRDGTLYNVDSEIRSHHYLSPIHSSPWRSYEKEYQLCLGKEDLITVAVRKDLSHYSAKEKDAMSKLVLIKTFSGPGIEDKLRILQQIRHANIISPLQIFKFEGRSHVVFEYMAVPLSSVATNPRLNDIRLAAILGQVRDHNYGKWAQADQYRYWVVLRTSNRKEWSTVR